MKSSGSVLRHKLHRCVARETKTETKTETKEGGIKTCAKQLRALQRPKRQKRITKQDILQSVYLNRTEGNVPVSGQATPAPEVRLQETRS